MCPKTFDPAVPEHGGLGCIFKAYAQHPRENMHQLVSMSMLTRFLRAYAKGAGGRKVGVTVKIYV